VMWYVGLIVHSCSCITHFSEFQPWCSCVFWSQCEQRMRKWREFFPRLDFAFLAKGCDSCYHTRPSLPLAAHKRGLSLILFRCLHVNFGLDSSEFRSKLADLDRNLACSNSKSKLEMQAYYIGSFQNARWGTSLSNPI
jgi:hypothetical protein